MIAVQARAKSVARRGRAVLEALDADPPPSLASDPLRQRERLCENLETLTDVDDRDLVSQRLAAAQRHHQTSPRPASRYKEETDLRRAAPISPGRQQKVRPQASVCCC